MSRPRSEELALGVKARLSNQEMELLRSKLAHAVAYDHVPESKRVERQAKALQAAKPMTRVYHRVPAPDDRAVAVHRPGRKTLASIQYEATFTEHAYDSARVPPPPKGISSAAKTLLQDEYMTQPRVVSSIPVRLMAPSAVASEREVKSGKRSAPAPIPQVFIL